MNIDKVFLMHRAKNISPEIWKKLQSFPRGFDLTWPASVKTFDGNYYPCVLFTTKPNFREIYKWGHRIEKDQILAVESVALIKPSPFKTPIAIEKKMYEHGETHMGGYIVKFILKDGTQYWHSSGDSLEFTSVPEGYQTSDVVDVIFPDRRESDKKEVRDKCIHSPDWKWCFFKKPTRK